MNTGTLGFPGSELLALFYGLIADYYGDPANISPAWRLCDGTNGTPDLRDRFVVGAGSTYALGATGGGVTTAYTPGGSVQQAVFTGSPMAGHTHDAGTIVADSAGDHTHTFTSGAPSAVTNVDQNVTAVDVGSDAHTHSGTTDIDGAHTHTTSGTSTSDSAGTPAGTINAQSFAGSPANISTLSPYFGLYKVMYVGLGTA